MVCITGLAGASYSKASHLMSAVQVATYFPSLIVFITSLIRFVSVNFALGQFACLDTIKEISDPLVLAGRYASFTIGILNLPYEFKKISYVSIHIEILKSLVKIQCKIFHFGQYIY